MAFIWDASHLNSQLYLHTFHMMEKKYIAPTITQIDSSVHTATTMWEANKLIAAGFNMTTEGRWMNLNFLMFFINHFHPGYIPIRGRVNNLFLKESILFFEVLSDPVEVTFVGLLFSSKIKWPKQMLRGLVSWLVNTRPTASEQERWPSSLTEGLKRRILLLVL